MVLAAMAGGMGWGIRGQYGHETGAMIAGVLVGFTLVLMFVPRSSSLFGARAVALMAAGVAFGGSMTYGQTVGLTHDGPLIGNWEAFRWGFLGLFIKGGIWIGFAGAFFGMGLSGKRYRPLEMAMLLPTLFVLLYLGMLALNQPFDPAARVLPWIYFSDDWYWEPGSDLKPRPESWGGLLVALLGLAVYVGFFRRDRLARNLAFVGFIAGGLGFSLGQCVQAVHAWNPEVFIVVEEPAPEEETEEVDDAESPPEESLDNDTESPAEPVTENREDADLEENSLEPAADDSDKTESSPESVAPSWRRLSRRILVKLTHKANWWNLMEITFGAIWGAVMALGLWLNRHLIAHPKIEDEVEPEIPPGWEFVLFAVHFSLIVGAEFSGDRLLVFYYLSFGLVMSTLPLMGIMGGRYWPYLFALPMVAVPIAGKTLLAMVYRSEPPFMSPNEGWGYLIALPLGVSLIAAFWLAMLGRKGQSSRTFARLGLLLTTWLYFGLNFAFFQVPWPWEEWTGRTHSGVIFIVFSICLTLAALGFGWRSPRNGEQAKAEHA
jgi:hypothetical protein